ncbi:MAG: hypothetical protein HYY95_07775 [Candidatus Rokubacteria bacterium]|nr:hypothetical protein [Candidatus Rokubacteria bacterium]
MSSPVTVHIFVEDRAHEAFLVPMLQRIAREESVVVFPQVRSARGGHGRAIAELKLYQQIVERGTPGLVAPDLLLAGIDGNCSTFATAKKAIEGATHAPFSHRLVVASPDPHVERWYLADPESFKEVVGHRPTIAKKKCVRNYYKNALANAVRKAGHPATLGGIEFAPELVERMDLYRAGKSERSLKAFVDDLRGKLRTLTQGR